MKRKVSTARCRRSSGFAVPPVWEANRPSASQYWHVAPTPAFCREGL